MDIEGIEIRGSADFILRTKEALRMLGETQCFKQVQQYIDIIKEGQHSAMRGYDEKPTYEVGEPTWRSSPIWYAGTIVHDGYHSKLYQEAKAKSGGKEPIADTWTGTEAEKKCLKYQLRALRELNANERLITYVEGLIKNPTYHKVEYEERWW